MTNKRGWVLHNKTKSREYNSWTNMKYRCYNPNNPSYDKYGGRGIKVCDRWLGRQGFVNFYKDMGTRPHNTTLDRINNNGDYEPNNCRWADRKTQQNNHRRCREFTVNNITLNVTQWSELTGINKNTLTKRLNKGWTPARAVGYEK